MSLKSPSLDEKAEIANAVTHAIGILLTIIATPIIINLGIATKRWDLTAGLGLYCLSLLMVYTSSTVYHCVRQAYTKGVLQKLDHISIYFLIGGTHTPFVLMFQHNSFGRYYLLLLWGFIFLGIVYKVFFMGKYKRLSLFFYLFLGWMAVFIIPYMLESMSWTCFYWILVGGAFYSIGAIFYSWEKLPYHHSIWHLFVLAGSAGHYIALCYGIAQM